MPRQMTRRQKRVSELIRREISTLLETRVKDPRIGFVTVTDVEVTFDLREATVYVSSLEDDPDRREEILEALNNAAGYLRHQLAENLRIKVIPRIRFEWDESLERGQRIERILRELSEASDEQPG